MRTLIIGGSGYVGSHLTAAFAAAGYDTAAMVRDSAKVGIVEAYGAKATVGDATDPAALKAAAHDKDVVVFAPQLDMSGEQLAVSTLLAAMKDSEATFIFTSGTAVLAQVTRGDWSEDNFAEDDPMVPLSWLIQRYETEQMVRAASDRGLRCIVMRPPLIWGHRGCGRVWGIADSVLTTGSACYLGSGAACYSNVHIDEVCDAYLLAVQKGRGGALYHMVSGELSNRAIAEAVACNMGVSTRSVTREEAAEIWPPQFAALSMNVSSRSRAPRARHELGWRPRKKLDLLEDILNGSYHDLRAGRQRYR